MSSAYELYERLLKAGVTKARAGDLDEAEDLLERALEQKPGDIRAMNMLGWVFWKRGEPEEAETYYRATLDIDPKDVHALKGLGLCLVDRERVDEGIALVERAIALRRNWAEPYHDLGVILYRLGRWDEAWRALDVARSLDPSLSPRIEDVLRRARDRAERSPR